MMKKMQNPLGGMMRYALLLPLFALILGCTVIHAQTKTANPAPEDQAAWDKDPKVLNLNEVVQKIGYPAEAKASGLEGKEIVRIKFDQQGKYVEHTFVRSSSEIFTKAVEAHIHELRAEPAMLNGKPVAVWLTLPFQFKLSE